MAGFRGTARLSGHGGGASSAGRMTSRHGLLLLSQASEGQDIFSPGLSRIGWIGPGKPHPVELRSRGIACVGKGHGHRKAAGHGRPLPRLVTHGVIRKCKSGGLAATGRVHRARGAMAPVATRERRAPDARDVIRGNRQQRSGPEHRFKSGRRVFSAGQQLAGGRGARVVPCRPSRTDLRLSAQNCPPGGLQKLLAKPPPSR